MGTEAAPAPGHLSRRATPESHIPRLSRRASPARCLTIASLALALLPGAAHAGTVSLGGANLRFAAAAGEANDVTITSSGGLFTVVDAGTIALTAGSGCTTVTATRVTCPTSGVSALSIDASDGDDAVTLAGVTTPATLLDGAGDDTVTGGSGNDTFVGAAGNDVLTGGPGTDAFGDAGGAGADTLSGGTGADTADYSSRTVPLTVLLDDQAGDGAADEGDDVRSDVETVNGGSAPDLLVGSPGSDTLRGNGGADTFDGRAGADTYAGGGDQDVADYSSRSNPVTVTLDGSAGDGETGENDNVGSDVDVVLGGSGADTLTGHSGTNELQGNDGDDTLGGSGGDDVLRGGPGGDRLDGGSGNDTLDGGAGTDGLTGGTGTDLLDYSARTGPVTADLGTTTGFGEAGEDDTAASDVEGVAGGSGQDVLTGDAAANVLRGNGGDDVLDGLLGADDVTGGDGTDAVSYAARSVALTIRLDNSANDGQSGEGDNIHSDVEHLTGGAGDDRIYADDDANVLVGSGGNDTIYGYGGNDTITLGGGTDQAWGGAGDDAIAGGDGINKLSGEDGNDALTGGSGSDTLDGGAGADRVLGGEGSDGVSGGNDGDVVEGGAGNDTVDGGRGADLAAGGEGEDKVYGNDDADTLGGGAGDDQVWGGSGDDVVSDTEGNNRIYGEDGLDHITAGAGADTLGGGGGEDLLDGGDGDDTVDGDDGGDRLQGGPGADRLHGGGGDDVLDGGLGPDQLDGADGTDTVDYGSRTIGVIVSNDGKADDGQPTEGDDVAGSVDNAIGSSGGDRITFATDWPHALDGGDGNDVLRGGPQPDTLTGGRGQDVLHGDGGKDAYDGGPGADRLSAVDALAETLACGSGNDVSVQDRTDVAVACEKRTVRTTPTTAGHAPATPDEGATVPAPVTAPSGLSGVRRVTSRGRFVAVPGQAGIRADRRILGDIAWILKHYPVRITASYAMSGHALHGEHPLGLATDIVPGPGGSWDDVDRLAKWAEPHQNQPRAPFRWVGYNGDVNHGRGNHLHLSWAHAASRPGKPAAWVMTMRFKRPAT